MRRRDLLASVAGAGTFALAGCTGEEDGGDGGGGSDGGDGGGSDGSDGSAPDVGASVSLDGIAFSPKRASIDPGQAVEWTNEESVSHDVTADQFSDQAADWEFAESLSEGASTTFTFEEAGVYEYQCTIHGASSMCGAVLVGDASLPEGALPCEDAGDGGDGSDGSDGGDDDDDGYY